MITSRCQCGEVYHAEERYIGNAIACTRCNAMITIKAQDKGEEVQKDLSRLDSAGETKRLEDLRSALLAWFSAVVLTVVGFVAFHFGQNGLAGALLSAAVAIVWNRVRRGRLSRRGE